MLRVMNRRFKINLAGRVQGVGLRPTIWRYATEAGLAGFVRNTSAGVTAEVQGAEEAVGRFLARLRRQPPLQARFEAFDTEELPVLAADLDFRIEHSQSSGDLLIGIPPDLATCAECAREIRDPANRRHGYPFTNCTGCGPRFTIVHALPYDRERTSMVQFAMCPDCRAEFTRPDNRRFDAQPNACPVCGPRLQWLDACGDALAVPDPLAAAVAALRQGAVVAVKGLGGYHLCCAVTDDAIRTLRARKQRPAKALAVMFRDLEEIRAQCLLDAAEAEELGSFAAPIVILRRRPDAPLSRLLSPDTDDIGAFLPYTPLHHLLLDQISPLIMTSGNRAEEPLAANEAELNELLGRLADFALAHNRPIVRRCDDSVLRLTDSGRLFYPHARGWVPEAIPLPFGGPPVLAVGGDLKSVFCLTRQRQAILSQHVGNLDEYASRAFLRQSVADFERLLQIQPEIVAHDLHPDYASTRFALERAAPLHVPVQHHHAHAAACMAEHRLPGPVIAVTLDGLGYGADGTLWGGEILVADYRSFRRAAHFKPYRLPGGDAATRHPVRMAWSCLVAEAGAEADALAAELFPAWPEAERATVRQMIERGVQSPWTSSAGRLFDAVAALLGFTDPISYEGQAAIRLQTLADRAPRSPYPFELIKNAEPWIISFGPALRALVAERRAGEPPARCAGRFHRTVVAAVVAACRSLRHQLTNSNVVLSGGVMQNDFLVGLLRAALLENRFAVFSHVRVPPNDGGLALGQAAVALAHFLS